MVKKDFWLKSLVVALIVIGGIWIGSSQGMKVEAANISKDEAINKIFPNANLAEEIKKELGKTSITDVVTQNELDTITSISGSGVDTIEGMQYLNNLTFIVFNKDNISDLSPLAGLTKMKHIMLAYNKIKDISPLANMTDLEYLSIPGNQISDISSLLNLTKLNHVELENNQISDISVLANLTDIDYLTLATNQISDISAVGNLTKLTYLTARKNKIKDISALANLTNLGLLNVSKNQISEVSALSNLKEITILDIDHNQISDVSPIASMDKLRNLVISDNQITDASPLASLPQLTSLVMSNNQITDISAFGGKNQLINLEASNQMYTNKPIDYQTDIAIPNIVKDITGDLIEPTTISNNGKYSSPDIFWNLSKFVKEVHYTFNKVETVGNTNIEYSGTIKQPIAPVYYTVHYFVDRKETTEKVQIDSLLKEPKTPTKEGYIFKGWYDEKTGGKKWNFKKDVMPANDLNLYAQFSKKASSAGSEGTDGNSGNNGNNGVSNNQATGEKVTFAVTNTSTSNSMLPTTGDSDNTIYTLLGLFLVGTGFMFFKRNRAESREEK
ncbi:leucine-rich repeat domain-containing protein [Listeria ivanovii]|uniref:leucine-rich repeat domain-containing protein n=1 Tax=Listeria ivanovii TaxID=1638 RepID=UPI00190C3A85|nr:leucine-rich repeat domain-containing protein [Listeria ivanovii]MBK3926344.1 LPXTG cell wall anchor domain-containing protein [Listeria ivanovii subsp. ivanovii]